MGTTADKLNRLIGTKEDIRKAIVSKGVSVSKDDTFSSYAGKIRAIPQEGGAFKPLKSDVNFIDYDGTILYSYTANDFLNLVEMPSLPSSDGLTCQEWNWNLEDAKQYVRNHGIIDVGATYITDDGKTRFYIIIDSEELMTVPICIHRDNTCELYINWGDGESDAVSGSGDYIFRHTYSALGEYVITLDASEDAILHFPNYTNIVGDSDNSGTIEIENRIIQRVEIGKYFTRLSARSFQDIPLTTITIPKNVTMMTAGVFENCYRLKAIVIPNGMTQLGAYGFLGCKSLASVSIPNTVTMISSSAGTTNSSNELFYGCSSLQRLCLPDSLTTFGSKECCYNCSALSELAFAKTITAIPSSNFSGCESLMKIELPENLRTIASSSFSRCRSLLELIFPSGLTSIGSSAFGNCTWIRKFDFSKCEQVPTGGSDMFANIQQGYRIIVPYQLYSDWIAAPVWSIYADYIIMNYTPEECVSLEITANEVMCGNLYTAKVHWTAVTNGVMLDGTRVENITLTGSDDAYIGLNKTSESVTKEVSYTYMGVTATTTVNQGSYLENCMVCKYNATSTTSATTLMYSSFSNYSTYFTSMIVDGVETTLAMTYKFPTLGEHTVIFKVADGVSITTPYRMFYNCTALTYVDCTELDLSAATSTSTSSGSAYMFYGCTKLERIILPDTIKYLGYYMFYNCVKVTSLTIKASTAPTVYGTSTWGSSSSYLGYSNRSKGTNKFYVPSGATGYIETGNWSYLYNTSYCGFTKEEVENL